MFLSVRDGTSSPRPPPKPTHGVCPESLKDKGVILNVGNPSETLLKV